MKRINMVFAAIILFYATGLAQKGNSQIGVGADLSIPTSTFASYFKTGIGAYAKALLGVGKSGQVSFTSGYSSFKQAGEVTDVTAIVSIVPLLIGYRANMNGFFAEPQIGYGVFGGKFMTADGVFTDSGGGFIWAAGVGYVFNKQIEVSARYQNGGNHGTYLGLFGLRLGYNFSLGGSK
jgi:hypothetical protein